MILELPISITVDFGLVILGVLFYTGGLVTVMILQRFRESTLYDHKDRYHADDAVVEAVVLEYTRRLRDYDHAISELRMRLDLVEIKTQQVSVQQPEVIPQQSISPSSLLSPRQAHHMNPVSEPVTVTQHAPSITSASQTSSTNVDDRDGQNNNGTVDYILKILADRPRTSRDVQHAIGRTREHTARLMKKLHESGLVSRDSNSKPFRYGITEAGRTRLGKEEASDAAQAPEIRR